MLDFSYGIVPGNRDIDQFLRYTIKVLIFKKLDSHIILIVYNLCSNDKENQVD